MFISLPFFSIAKKRDRNIHNYELSDYNNDDTI